MDGEVRHRRKRTTVSSHPPPGATPSGSARPPTSRHEETQNGAADTPETAPLVLGERSGVERHWTGLPLYVGWLSRAVGLLMLIAASVTHATYMLTLHENDLWFSKIKEVEREISFRTESGLYYSYYKQLISAPSICQGVDDLIKDNLTEHGRTINILARMNIYQEVVLAAVYKAVPLLQSWFEPIYFYINSIFALHGMLVGALYTLTWLLSGSWLAGLLAASFYIFNKEDTTRVSFVIPLRESFALPFLWVQLVFITLYFKPRTQYTSKKFQLVGVAACTFLFSITWQFNQFVLLLQAMALFAVQVLEFVPLHKVRNVYLLQMGSLLAVCLLQFGNTMILSGPCFSFLLAALCVMLIQKRVRPVGVIRNIVTVILYIILVFLLMAIFILTAKVVMQQEADEHIGKFVLTKFGVYGDMSQRDFDVRLYLCNAAFAFIGRDVFERMTRSLVFPIYAYMHAVMVAILVIAYIQKTSTKQSSIAEGEEADHMFRGRPDLAYHVIQTVFFGALAVSTLRMKYLWTPYMCVLAAVGVSDKTCTTWLLERCNVTSSKAVAAVRHFLTIVVLICFLHLVLPKARKDLEDLREFYDPDTVDLMNWIKQHTAETAALAGSMQLLAGVKLCTGRPITNHPHYEDKHLRERTKQLYQMYGRRTPEDVHAIFMKYDVSYIILEDSICMAPSRGNCRLPDMMDIDNGVIPDNGAPLQDLVKSKVPRFCDKIRHGDTQYTKYFKAVFANKTFRVYKVLRSQGSHRQKGTQ